MWRFTTKRMADADLETEACQLASGKFANYPVLKSFLAGSVSGTLSTIVFQPLDLVKTRLQIPHVAAVGDVARSVGMIPILSHIYQTEQVIGLWRGMTPSLLRCVPGVGLYFASLHSLKVMAKIPQSTPMGPLECLGLGMSARCISGVCLIPFTVLKTRFESGVYRYNNIGDAFRTIYRLEGARGLVCGLVPTLFRDAPFSGLYLMFYSQTKQALPETWLNSGFASPLHFSCGITAGILASIVTQPADVVKTKMQLYPNEYKTVLAAIIETSQKNGPSGFFQGLVPRMLRRTLMAAMAWTLYEQITRSIGLK